MKKILIVGLLLLCQGTYCMAASVSSTSIKPPNPDLENADLVRINTLLNAVYPLIDEAESTQDKNARVIFNYDALRMDIQLIQNGIAQKINQAPLVPRTVTPLANDFLTNQTVRGNP